VFTDADDRASYLDPFALGDGLEHAASAAVAPASTDELTAVLNVANEYRVPLWPVSMGKNFAYGTAAPVQPGSVVLDLKRMNRVLEINAELGYAVVEPGVSFFDFKEALDAADCGLWMSGPSHSWGSVIGNALEHGVGYTPYGIHAETICGMEVMLANGTLVRTGYGANEGGEEWQCYKWPFGPMWDGVFTQSNFGIVTKMGLWLMPEPAGMAGVSIDVPGKGDLPKLIEALRPLKLDDTINATYTIVNGWRRMTGGGTVRSEVYDGEGAVPEEVVDRLLASRGQGWWNVSFNLFDRPAALDIRLEAIRERFADVLPDATMSANRWQKGEPLQPWNRQDVSLAPLGVVDWMGSPAGHTDFGPLLAARGERVGQAYELVERRFIEHGMDPWVGMFGIGGRAVIFVADLIYNRADEDMVRRCRALFKQLCEDFAGIGASVYRSHITFMDEAAAMQSWNEHAFGRFNSDFKALVDPNGILAPGKQGIWPRERT
jgi:4-cresol dehydrogenase (hydroxylating)